MKLFMTLTVLLSINSTCFARAHDACTDKVLAHASMIEETSQDYVQSTPDKQTIRAQQLLSAVRELQKSPDVASASATQNPILSDLCKNGLSVQKTIAQ